MVAPNYFVKIEDLKPYSPANHSGTVNRRIIGPETVGARNMEVLLGIVTKEHGATKHHHPGIEQAAYMLEGRGRLEIGGQSRDVGPGDAFFCPAGVPHAFTVTSDEPAKILVIYSPPYVENPKEGIAG